MVKEKDLIGVWTIVENGLVETTEDKQYEIDTINADFKIIFN